MRFVEDDWESPTLGAWGLGWEVWIDGMEVTQFTYFQQVGGFECNPVPVEIAYGLERLTMYIQGVDSMFDIVWSRGADGVNFTYGDVYLENERQYSRYNFEVADTDFLFQEFNDREAECLRTLEAGLPLPAYDSVLKCCHAFNLLDARGVISAPSAWPTSCACAPSPRRCAPRTWSTWWASSPPRTTKQGREAGR